MPHHGSQSGRLALSNRRTPYTYTGSEGQTSPTGKLVQNFSARKGSLPEFRRRSGVTAFVEGWGLYSERLGYDMGLYKDPYSRYGQLVYDMWRAVRLVVDTGIHYFGWSRERAINFFLANAAKTEADIVNEIDRYIGWPGQALAYKIGQLKMLKLRETAELALGNTFDIRAFHDHLLGAGAIPLDALEARMDTWLRGQLAAQVKP